CARFSVPMYSWNSGLDYW
nr:immunoglobulin heavy chain junction region [Macaca mulatta]